MTKSKQTKKNWNTALKNNFISKSYTFTEKALPSQTARCRLGWRDVNFPALSQKDEILTHPSRFMGTAIEYIEMVILLTYALDQACKAYVQRSVASETLFRPPENRRAKQNMRGCSVNQSASDKTKPSSGTDRLVATETFLLTYMR